MITETLTPTLKDSKRLNFQRRNRSQDHGTAANTYEHKDAFEHERALRFKEQVARRELEDELAVLSPSQLEKEADRFIAEADKTHDADSKYILDNQDYTDDELESLLSEDEAAAFAIETHISGAEEADYQRKVGYGSLGLIMQKRHHKAGNQTERQYQGTTGDDDDTRGDIERGYKFTDRP